VRAPAPARLTPIPRLGEWIMIALLDLDLRTAEADPTSADVLTRIGEMFGALMTPADRQPDPVRPWAPRWQSRVRLARRCLGADDLVRTQQRRWRLTSTGHAAAVDFVRRVLRSPRQLVPAPR
jgi:hypothetical protein